MLASVETILRILLVSEQRFLTAGGRVRYNPLDFQTLRFIELHPGCRGADIAKHNEVAPTTQQSALDRLIRRGLVRREDHAEDRGAKAHFLTDDGQSLRAAIRTQDLANMTAMLAALTPEERAVVVPALARVAERLAAST